jgi:hypothetical protein
MGVRQGPVGTHQARGSVAASAQQLAGGGAVQLAASLAGIRGRRPESWRRLRSSLSLELDTGFAPFTQRDHFSASRHLQPDAYIGGVKAFIDLRRRCTTSAILATSASRSRKRERARFRRRC